MSAILKKSVLIEVTRGDCLDKNRKSGKSNSGTYFLCSVKNFDEYEEYFNDKYSYEVDLIQVEIYKKIFKEYFEKFKDEYNGKMLDFDTYCNYLLSLNTNPNVSITTRQNDSRIFMKFTENSNSIVKAFRNLLYEDLSFIALEKNNKKILVYPVININKVKFENELNDDLILDE